jgi:hypothetical protein
MKRKINIDREKLSPEEIRAGKDFNAVLKQFQAAPVVKAKPFFKSTGFLVTVVSVVVSGLGIWAYQATQTSGVTVKANHLVASDKSLSTPAPTDSRTSEISAVNGLKIQAPLKDLTIPYHPCQLDAARGGDFTSDQGTKIHVPQHAFADAYGKALSGKVELRIREFHDPVDFYLSGIPMTYDSGGTRFQFESAGMVEILGYQEGKPVYIVPGKKVDITLVSRFPESTYNLYRFDSVAGNWIYLGKNFIINREKRERAEKEVAEARHRALDSLQQPRHFESQPEALKLDGQITALRTDSVMAVKKLPVVPDEPQKSRKADKSSHRFNVDFDPQEFPEMNQYKKVVFEVGAENKKFDEKEAYNTIWDDMQLSEGNKKGKNYKLTLKKGLLTREYIVYPVLEGQEYAAAIDRFDQSYKEYVILRDQRLAKEKEIHETYEKQIEALEKQRQEMVLKWEAKEKQRKAEELKALDTQFESLDEGTKVLRTFSVSGFGIYNCDQPSAYPKGSIVKLLVRDEKFGNSFRQFYHMDKSLNALFTYSGTDKFQLHFNPASYNLLWTSLDGKLYILSNEAIQHLKDVHEAPLELTEVKEKFKDVAALKRFMGI